MGDLSADERPAAASVWMVGLGANLGEPRRTLAAAVQALRAFGELRGVSALYATEPVGPPQPAYLNAAVGLLTTLEPEPLLARLLEVERAFGRERRERWGPRTLDLDLLLGPRAIALSTLEVPHPRLCERAFALVPLLDVLPEAQLPDGTRLASVAAQLDCAGIRRIEAPGWERV